MQSVDPQAPESAASREASSDGAGPALEATYYTDPLCPWSWAMEPHWRRFRLECGGRLAWRYVMGGMIADWRSYHDAINSVHNPGQMAVQWYQVRDLTGMPFDERIWRDDPPSSSYPACLAVEAAARQGSGAGEAYLRRVREAVMARRRNVARAEVLLELAEELTGDRPRGVVLDVGRFRDDLLGEAARDDLHDDLREVRYREIARFPTLVLRAGDRDAPAIALVGYRPYEVPRDAADRLTPGAGPPRDAAGALAYVSYWGGAVAGEVAGLLGIGRDAASRLLDDTVGAGALRREETLPDGYRAREPR